MEMVSHVEVLFCMFYLFVTYTYDYVIFCIGRFLLSRLESQR